MRRARCIVVAVLAATWLLGGGSGWANAQNAALPDRAVVGRHLDTVFGSLERVVRKWPDDIRYSVLGAPSPGHREGVRRAIGAIAEATGLDASDVTGTGEPATIVLYFAKSIDELLPDQWLARLFRNDGESAVAFEARMRERFEDGGWLTAHDYDGDDENVSLSIANVGLDNGDPAVLAMRMTLAAFFAYNPSDTIKPSLMNPGPMEKPELGPIDKALLAALYDGLIESGVTYAEVRSLMIDLVRGKLGGI